jgi:hypothetical protein
MRIPKQPITPVFNLAHITTTSTATGAMEASLNQKGKQMLIVDIPKEATFNLPEGRYVAKISSLKPSIKQAGLGSQNWIRILFDVHVPGLSERFDTRAGRNFKLDFNSGSELRNFLTGLVGRDFFLQNSGGKVDLESLVNTGCEVELEHSYGKGYDKPHVNVVKVHPVRSTTPALEKITGGKD